MKKASILFGTLTLLALCSLFVSCNEDVERSMALSGQWRGDWGMYYEIEHRGRIYRFDSYDTDIVFYPARDYATYGYGYQVDWYREGPYERMSYRFEWSIDNDVVRMYYPGYPEYNARIHDYYLSYDVFRGYFDGSSTPFRLYKLVDYYNWDDYARWDYHYWDSPIWSWDIYYMAKSRDGQLMQNATADTPSDSARVVKIGNRFDEK